MGWVWSLSFLILIHFTHSHVPGTGHSEVVSPLKRSRGDDAVFRLDQKIGNDTQRIMWILASKQLILAKTSAGESIPDWIINSTQYEGRLSLLPDKSLMISNLTTEDSGCYQVQIISVSGTITTQKFNLTLFETDNTEPNMNPENRLHRLVLLGLPICVVLLILCVCYQGLRGTHKRNIPHTEENGPEEENEHSQMTFPQTNEQRLRIPGFLAAITIQDDAVIMLNRDDTESSTDRS